MLVAGATSLASSPPRVPTGARTAVAGDRWAARREVGTEALEGGDDGGDDGGVERGVDVTQQRRLRRLRRITTAVETRVTLRGATYPRPWAYSLCRHACVPRCTASRGAGKAGRHWVRPGPCRTTTMQYAVHFAAPFASPFPHLSPCLGSPPSPATRRHRARTRGPVPCARPRAANGLALPTPQQSCQELPLPFHRARGTRTSDHVAHIAHIAHIARIHVTITQLHTSSSMSPSSGPMPTGPPRLSQTPRAHLQLLGISTAPPALYPLPAAPPPPWL